MNVKSLEINENALMSNGFDSFKMIDKSIYRLIILAATALSFSLLASKLGEQAGAENIDNSISCAISIANKISQISMLLFIFLCVIDIVKGFYKKNHSIMRCDPKSMVALPDNAINLNALANTLRCNSKSILQSRALGVNFIIPDNVRLLLIKAHGDEAREWLNNIDGKSKNY